MAWRWMELLLLQTLLVGIAAWLWGPWAGLAGALLALKVGVCGLPEPHFSLNATTPLSTAVQK